MHPAQSERGPIYPQRLGCEDKAFQCMIMKPKTVISVPVYWTSVLYSQTEILLVLQDFMYLQQKFWVVTSCNAW